MVSLHVKVCDFPSAGSVTGSWPKHSVVSWELLKFACGSAVCQCMQSVYGESARLQEFASVFGCRSSLFLSPQCGLWQQEE